MLNPGKSYLVSVYGSFGKGDGFDLDDLFDHRFSGEDIEQLLSVVKETGQMTEGDEDFPERIRAEILEEVDDYLKYDSDFDVFDADLHASDIRELMPPEVLDLDEDSDEYEEAYEDALDEFRDEWKVSDDYDVHFSLGEDFMDDLRELAESRGIEIEE